MRVYFHVAAPDLSDSSGDYLFAVACYSTPAAAAARAVVADLSAVAEAVELVVEAVEFVVAAVEFVLDVELVLQL